MSSLTAAANDGYRELADICHEADSGSARDEHELVCAVTGKSTIAGREFPAPTAAVIALLDVIHSPFVSEFAESSEITELDIFRALYLLAEREKAALPVLRMKRRAEMLEKLPEPTDPETAYIYVRSREQLADAEGDFDAAALRFADTLGVFDFQRASTDLCCYLTLATGFSMLPDSSESGTKKKDVMTSTT